MRFQRTSEGDGYEVDVWFAWYPVSVHVAYAVMNLAWFERVVRVRHYGTSLYGNWHRIDYFTPAEAFRRKLYAA